MRNGIENANGHPARSRIRRFASSQSIRRFAAIDLLLALIQHLFVPIRDRKLLFVPGEVVPGGFQRSELLLRAHLIQRQRRVHREMMQRAGASCNRFRADRPIGRDSLDMRCREILSYRLRCDRSVSFRLSCISVSSLPPAFGFPDHDMAVVFFRTTPGGRQMMRFLHAILDSDRRRRFGAIVIFLPSFIRHRSPL